MKIRVISSIVAISLFATALIGCGSQDAQTPASGEASISEVESGDTLESGPVELNVWAEESTFDLMNEVIDSFIAEYGDKADFTINLVAQPDASTKDAVLADVHAAGDIFSYPDDQFDGLLAAGVLAPMDNQDMIKSSYKEDAVAAITYDGVVYGIPYTADNGYFLYYDKRYISDEDAKTLDSLLAACEAADKKMSMDLTSGWYLYSFFGGTGLDFGINDDGVTNHCNWNSTDGDVKGVDVGNAIKALTASPYFVPEGDTGFVSGAKDGSIAAGISGTWNAVAVKDAWGDDYGAVKLPTYTCGGKQIQMASFKGFKNMGVNEYSKHKAWAKKLCEYLTNEDNQTLRLEKLNQGPANIAASQSEAVLSVPAICAVMDQAQFAQLQRVGGKYWGACTDFANALITGDTGGKSMQELLDTLVDGITASTAD